MEHIERQTGELLGRLPSYIWDGRALPIPIEAIADDEAGLLVLDKSPAEMIVAAGVPDEGQTISGLLLPAQREIWVNAEEAKDWPTRRRFTIAHELGHWYLHQNGQQSLFCRHGSIDEDSNEERPNLALIEQEANWFAATLLMPAEMVRRQYERTGGDFRRLCSTFKSSGAAMGRRLHQAV